MSDVTRPNEVSLFGQFYPIVGPVQVVQAARWAPKTVTGDYTQDSEEETSSHTWSDQRGGIGMKEMVEGKDDNRCDWSTCDLSTKGHLILPRLVTDCDNPTTLDTDCVVLAEYNDKEYAFFGTDVRRWTETTATWSTSLRTLGGSPTDALAHKNKLYVAIGADFERFDVSTTTWTTGTVLAGTAVPSRYLCEWDGKLFSLDNNGQLRFSVDEGVTWTDSALSGLTTGMFTSLTVVPSTDGRLLPCLGTKVGRFDLDFDAAVWLPTPLALPSHATACNHPTLWRDGNSYWPVGMSVYQYQVSGEAAIVTPVGPDRDYGVPADYRGNIISLAGEHNYIFALIDATSAGEDNLFTGHYEVDTTFTDPTGYSVLLKWNGTGWSVAYVGGALAEAAKVMNVSTADSTYRLWFAMDKKVFYLPLEIDLVNPLEVADWSYQTSCLHEYSWFDANAATVSKTAFKVVANVATVSATEYIKVYYGKNGDNTTWTLLTNATFPDGQIDVAGETEFTFASDVGLEFKSIRFKTQLYRGSSTSVTPDVLFLRLNYIKNLDRRKGFEIVVDCSRDYRRQRASTLISNLETAADTKTLGAFSYRTQDNVSESYQVRIADDPGFEKGGRNLKVGQFKVSLMVL